MIDFCLKSGGRNIWAAVLLCNAINCPASEQHGIFLYVGSIVEHGGFQGQNLAVGQNGALAQFSGLECRAGGLQLNSIALNDEQFLAVGMSAFIKANQHVRPSTKERVLSNTEFLFFC
jgi:hypothetical protein